MNNDNISNFDRAWWRSILEGKTIKSVIFSNPASRGMLVSERIQGFELDNGVVISINDDGKLQTREAGPFAYGTGGD